jgi:hypothetical protein
VQAIKVVPARDVTRNSRSIQGVLSTARDEHVIHTFLDKTFAVARPMWVKSAGYDRNLIRQFPAILLSRWPFVRGSAWMRRSGVEVVSNVLLIIASLKEVAETTQNRGKVPLKRRMGG